MPAWSPERTHELHVLHSEGRSAVEIAQHFGISAKAVRGKFRQQGIVLKQDMWPIERVARLKELWAEGWPISRIAQLMGDTSRNGVMGKVRRLGLEGRGVTFNRMRDRSAPPRGCASVPVPKPAPKPILDAPDSLNISIDQLTGKHCKYPYGTDAPFTFCGHPVAKHGETWCEYHRAIVYNRVAASPEQIAKAIEARLKSSLKRAG